MIVMYVGSTRVVALVVASASLMGIGAFAGLTQNVVPLVDEVLARTALIARNAPVDYGPGPGRGRPHLAARPHPSRSRYDTGSVAAGSVTGIWLSDRGSYFFMPSCQIGPPNSPSGQQALCSPYAFGLSAFPLSVSGTGYKVGEALTMNPTTGLNCPILPALKIQSVDATGAVTGLTSLNAGMCLTFPTTGTFSFSGGSGTGYVAPAGKNGIRWYVAFAKVSGGSGYTSAPAVTFQAATPFNRAAGTTTIATAAVAPAVPPGGPTAAIQGVFGAPLQWPINAIHMALLPDGRILNYGSDEYGQQTGALLYDIWDPALGTGMDAHLVLPNTTSTDIFCGNTSVMWTTGKVMMTGGDLTVNGVRNYANNKTTIFSPATDSVATGVPMHYPRWYPTIVPLPNGDKLVMGGWVTRDNGTDPVQPATTPEVYHAATGWRSLSSVNVADWYYPRAFITPAGTVFHVDPSGAMSSITTSGTGALQRYNSLVPAGNSYIPTVMFAPGKLLSIRKTSVVVIDVNGTQPIVTPTANLDQLRDDGSATLLADGRVLVNGGSTVHNALTGVAYTTQIWDPATGKWTTGASATKPRLYHSNALLLPDGSVLTAGGGSPGPVVNLNAEIYYPSYLYTNDGSGRPAQRPAILDVQPQAGIGVGAILGLTMGDAGPVSRVTLVRSGAATHATNMEQRFLDVTATLHQNGQLLSVALPANANVLLPGYYLVFVFNQANVPSIARQILVTN
jgi:hypothetical protein